MNWDNVKSSVEALLASQNGLITTFVWRDKTYKGVRTNLRREDVASDAGLYAGGYQFSLLCALSQFSACESPSASPSPSPSAVCGFPADRRELLTIDGQSYRVLSTDLDSIRATVRLNLGEVNA